MEKEWKGKVKEGDVKSDKFLDLLAAYAVIEFDPHWIGLAKRSRD